MLSQNSFNQHEKSIAMLPENAGTIIGVDEAGRGPVLGPLVVAGVVTQDQESLQELGVRDSKDLTPHRRESLSKEIRRMCDAEVYIISASEIDFLRGQYTLNQIEVDAFSRVIRKLLAPRVLNDEVTLILDSADVDEERFGRGVEEKLLLTVGSVSNIISKHKADTIYPAVSAASIIAKVTRDGEMERLRQQHGKLGSGYPSDPVTRDYLMKLYKSGNPIPDFVRKSWETISKIRGEAGTKKLDDFL